MGFSVVNYDRNPGDVDFFEYGFQVAIGAPLRTEFFVGITPWLRTNSVGQEPFGYPVPPLDLFVDTYPNLARRPGPLFLFAQEVPYKTYFVDGITIRPPGDGAFASSTGSNTFGLKVSLVSQERRSGLGLGLRGYVQVPTERPRYNSPDWRKLAGVSGKTNIGVDLLLAREWKSTEVLGNIGFKKVGDPSRGIRLQHVDSSQSDPGKFLVGSPAEIALDLKDEVRFDLGVARPAFTLASQQFWFVGGFSYKRYVGKGTPVERLVHPAEMNLGMQFTLPRYRALTFAVAWQILFNDAGDGSNRSSHLRTADGRGDINFSELMDPSLAATVKSYFASRGAGFSEGASKVFSTNNAAFDGWRNISARPTTIIGQGGGNILFSLTWRFDVSR